MLKKIILYFLVITSICSIAHAQQPLTHNDIKRALATIQTLSPYLDKIEAEMYADQSHDSDILNPKMISKQMQKLYSYNEETKDIITKNNFTQKQWINISSRVMNSFTSLAIEEEYLAEVDMIQSEIKTIQNNKNLSNSAKQKQIKKLQFTLKSVNSMMRASKQDIEAVRPFYIQLSSDGE